MFFLMKIGLCHFPCVMAFGSMRQGLVPQKKKNNNNEIKPRDQTISIKINGTPEGLYLPISNYILFQLLLIHLLWLIITYGYVIMGK